MISASWASRFGGPRLSAPTFTGIPVTQPPTKRASDSDKILSSRQGNWATLSISLLSHKGRDHVLIRNAARIAATAKKSHSPSRRRATKNPPTPSTSWTMPRGIGRRTDCVYMRPVSRKLSHVHAERGSQTVRAISKAVVAG